LLPAALLGFAALPTSAKASVVDITRHGRNVAATGVGPLDLTGSDDAGFGAPSAEVDGAAGVVSTGSVAVSGPASGPASFGGGLLFAASSTAGDGHADSLTVEIGTISPVPEAPDWAMMPFGFAGIGFIACPRKSTLMTA
jgi:hypothetical protein